MLGIRRIIWLLSASVAWAQPTPPASEPVSYLRDIRPIIQRSCQGCHQPASKMSGLDLTSYSGLLSGGAKGPAVIAGDPATSLLPDYLSGKRQPRMPLGQDPLPREQIELIERWIEDGARDDTTDHASAGENLDEPPSYRLPPVINSMAFSPDGSLLAVAGYREVLLHRSDGSALVGRLVGLSERIQSLLFSADGGTLYAAGGSPARFGEIQAWDVASRELAYSISACDDTIFGASLSSDQTHLAFGCPDHTVRIHQTDGGQERHRSSYHENWVLGTAFTVNGKQVVSVGRDRAARVADVASGSFLETVNKLRGELAAIARHPTRDTILIGGKDRIPYHYRVERARKMVIADDSTLIREFEMQKGEIAALAFHPDGARFAVAGSTPEVPIYDVDSGERLLTLTGHQAGIYALAFDPSGERLATGGYDGIVRIYDLSTGKRIHQFVPVPIEQAVSAPKER